MSTLNFGYKDKEGEVFKKLEKCYSENLKKIEQTDSLDELKKISVDLAKTLLGFQNEYYMIFNLVQKSKQKEFQFEYTFKRARFITASYYIEKFGLTQKEALLRALNEYEVTNSEGAKLIEKWEKTFKDKTMDFEIGFVKDFQKFLKKNPQYKKAKK